MLIAGLSFSIHAQADTKLEIRGQKLEMGTSSFIWGLSFSIHSQADTKLEIRRQKLKLGTSFFIWKIIRVD
jgi:hypothetical protein